MRGKVEKDCYVRSILSVRGRGPFPMEALRMFQLSPADIPSTEAIAQTLSRFPPLGRFTLSLHRFGDGSPMNRAEFETLFPEWTIETERFEGRFQ